MIKRQRFSSEACYVLISGIVGSQRSHFDKLAAQVSAGGKPASCTKRFARWVANDAVTPQLFYLPFAKLLLASLAHSPLVLVDNLACPDSLDPTSTLLIPSSPTSSAALVVLQ